MVTISLNFLIFFLEMADCGISNSKK